jgi:hypothetical protein
VKKLGILMSSKRGLACSLNAWLVSGSNRIGLWELHLGPWDSYLTFIHALISLE